MPDVGTYPGTKECDCCGDTCCCGDSGDGDYPFCYANIVLNPAGSTTYPCTGTDKLMPTWDEPGGTGSDYLSLDVFGSPSPPDPVTFPAASTSVLGVSVTIDNDTSDGDALLVGTDYSADFAGVFAPSNGVALGSDTAVEWTITFGNERRVCAVCFHIGAYVFGTGQSVTVLVTDNEGHTETATVNAQTVIYIPFSFNNSAVVCAAYQGRSITEIKVTWNDSIDDLDGTAIGFLSLCTQPVFDG